MKIQTIGHSKINQLRHARFFVDRIGVINHMRKHAAIVKPKFELVQEVLKEQLGGTGLGSWTNPEGGYFLSFDTLPGCAKKVVKMMKEAGVVMTGAGATYPYGKDPDDSNIRIAPTFAELPEIRQAFEVFGCVVKLVSAEQALQALG